MSNTTATISLLQQMQRLSCVQTLIRTLTDALGPPPDGEEAGYHCVATMLLGNFEKAQAALDLLNSNNAGDGPIQKQNQQGADPRVALRALFSICLSEMGEDDEASCITQEQLDRRIAATAAAAHDDEDDDNPPLLEPDVEQACFDVLHARLCQAELRKAVARGAQVLLRNAAAEMAEHELRREDQRRREQAARAAAFHSELRRLGGGATGTAASSNAAVIGNADADFGIGIDLSMFDGQHQTQQQQQHQDGENGGLALEIERCDREPHFLRAMGVNFRDRLAKAERDLRRRQQEQLREKEIAKRTKLGVSGARLAQLAVAAKQQQQQQQQQRPATLAAAGASGGNKTSMEMAIERREVQARIQREVEKRHSAMVAAAQQEEANAAAGNLQNLHQQQRQSFNTRAELGESLNPETASNLVIPYALLSDSRHRRGGGGGLLNAPGGDQQHGVPDAETAAQLAAQRRGLPIAPFREQIIETIRAQRATVVSAETGSGKTTQVPQYLLEAGFASLGGGQNKRQMIAVTQPRLIAAQLVATRVAREHGCALGEEVGYTVRFDDRTSPRTLLKYMTDGVLLREALLDPAFERYSVIILDEAHERNLNTDILFALCKAALTKNKQLRLVATSATLDVERFCAYFGCERPLEIPGRSYPVDSVFLREPCEDYFETALETIMTIHVQERPGDILVFLTGRDEIENARKRLERWLEHEELQNMPPLIVTRLYAGLPDEEKARALVDTPPLSRKVILSTNIAETSVTINGIYFVVDCGYCKENVYNPETRVDTLAVVPIAQSQAKQRKGRAGRTGPGRCFFLYTEEQFLHEMSPSTTPEIQRTNLASVVLTLKALGVQDLLALDFMDPPPLEALVSALEQLYFLSALDADGVLTQLGSRMSQLPVAPNEGRTLLAAQDLGCLGPVITVVAMLGEQHVFHRPREASDEADQARLSFTAPEGDHITLLRVFEAAEEQGFDHAWCRANYINPAAVQRCNDLRAQLHGILRQRGIRDAANSDDGTDGGSTKMVRTAAGLQRAHDLVSIRKAFVAGNFYQAARRVNNAEYISVADRRQVALHPTSALFHVQPTYCLWHTLVETTKEYMREAIAVDPAWLLEMAPNFFSSPGAGVKTKAQASARIDPILRANETSTSWRVSKMRQNNAGGRGRR